MSGNKDSEKRPVPEPKPKTDGYTPKAPPKADEIKKGYSPPQPPPKPKGSGDSPRPPKA